MVLDGVLADRSVTWLGSEREKRRYFKQRLGDSLRDDEYPRLVFGKTANVTVRYFPDKLPIGYEPDRRRHVFLYLARNPSPMDFRVFILRQLELLNALDFWTTRVPLSTVPRVVDGCVRERGPRTPYQAVEPLANRGIDMAPSAASDARTGRFGGRSSTPASSSKGVSQSALRRDQATLVGGRKPCGVPDGITRSSRYIGASASECRVRGTAAQLRASLCSRPSRLPPGTAKQGG